MFGKNKKVNPEAINELTTKDVKQMLANCKCYKATEVAKNPWRVESLPEARMRDKYCRDNNYEVMTSSFNPVDKSIIVEYVTKVDQSDKLIISYQQICNHFGWDKFDISENKQTIYPKWS